MTRVYWCAQHATVRDSELARFKAHEAGACSCNNDGAAPNGEGSVKAAAAAAAAAVATTAVSGYARLHSCGAPCSIGPLHGVPVTVKERFAVQGFRQTMGR